MTWNDLSPAAVGAQYDRIAPFYRFFEWAYGLPLLGVRGRTVGALALAPGDRVLEVGCGSGFNFGRVVDRIGSTGTLIGIDVSQGMLARAAVLVAKRGWGNVELHCADATTFTPEPPIDAVLFSFSYSTLPDRTKVLTEAWRVLEPGGRLVVTDAFLRPGWPRRVFGALSVRVSRSTLAGNPFIDLADEICAVTGDLTERRLWFAPGIAGFSICSATKPAAGRGS